MKKTSPSEILPGILNLKKVELHRHIEGCIDLEFVRLLIDKYSPSEEIDDLQPLTELFNYSTFNGFLDTFGKVVKLLKEIDDFEILARHVVTQLKKDNVVYVELLFSPQNYLKQGMVLSEILNPMHKIFSESGIKTRLITDFVRQWSLDSANNCLDKIIDVRQNFPNLRQWIKAVCIGGDELNHPPRKFAYVFDRAKKSGLNLYAHAGEWADAQSIWDALNFLKIQRVGHGINAVNDPKLVKYLIDNNIGLDISITSNFISGAIENGQDHPILSLLKAGVGISVNTDDPGFFRTDLNREYQILFEMGVNLDDLKNIPVQALHNSFLDDRDKKEILSLL